MPRHARQISPPSAPRVTMTRRRPQAEHGAGTWVRRCGLLVMTGRGGG